MNNIVGISVFVLTIISPIFLIWGLVRYFVTRKNTDISTGQIKEGPDGTKHRRGLGLILLIVGSIGSVVTFYWIAIFGEGDPFVVGLHPFFYLLPFVYLLLLFALAVFIQGFQLTFGGRLIFKGLNEKK
ncbi:MAG: hypothetical protein Q7R89_02615 [bacterium]|nr:hypothetical protein [bacterium]